MKTIIFLCCLFLIASVGFAQKNVKTNSGKFNSEAIQKEILRLEELGRTKSLRGDSYWDEIWADGAYIIDPFGKIIVYQKGQNLSAGGFVPKSLKLSDMIVRAYGEVAVVTALMEIESETADKKPLSFQLRFMHVWKKHDDGWKIVAAERTPVRPPPKIN